MTFSSWLLQQADRDDPVGDLARDHAWDIEHGCGKRIRTAVGLAKHIRREHSRYIDPAVLSAIRSAWDEYRSTTGAPGRS